MTQNRLIASALTLGLVGLSSSAIRADVRADEKARIEFAGMLGRMFNMFGGKGAREGVTSTVAVKGDRKAKMNDTTGQIIDLNEEKVYDLDVRKKTYKVTTFDELRRKMQEAQQKAAAREDAKPAEKKAAPDKQEPQVEVDFDIKDTGQKKSINGFDTHETIVTVTVREKGKTLEQGGGLVMTTDTWLTADIPAMKDVAAFDMKYAQKLYGPVFAEVSAEQMATAMAMYPMMKPAISKMNADGGKINGTAILTTVTMDSVKSEDQMAQDAKQQSDSSSDKGKTPIGVGSMLGGFAKRAAAKKSGGDDAASARATFMTTTTEVLKVVTDVSAADVAIPAGYKESK
jgi:hypothetical protein